MFLRSPVIVSVCLSFGKRSQRFIFGFHLPQFVAFTPQFSINFGYLRKIIGYCLSNSILASSRNNCFSCPNCLAKNWQYLNLEKPAVHHQLSIVFGEVISHCLSNLNYCLSNGLSWFLNIQYVVHLCCLDCPSRNHFSLQPGKTMFHPRKNFFSSVGC